MPHTAGPWSNAEENCITADFGGVGICILEPIEEFWCGDAARHPEGKEYLANAMLIAAAPNLLKRCQHLAKWLKEWGNPIQIGTNEAVDPWAELEGLEADILKATKHQ